MKKKKSKRTRNGSKKRLEIQACDYGTLRKERKFF